MSWRQAGSVIISAHALATECLYSVVTEGEATLFTFDPFQRRGSQFFHIEDDDLPQLYNGSLSPNGATLAIVKWRMER